MSSPIASMGAKLKYGVHPRIIQLVAQIIKWRYENQL